jgi:hypothetical protein
MKDEDGRWFCDQCGRRSAKGGIRATVVPADFFLRRLKAGEDVLYCSERCVLDVILGLDDSDDPVDVLTRRVRSLERALDRQRRDFQDDLDAARDEAARSIEPMERMRDVVAVISEEGLLDAVEPSDRGARLMQLLTNLKVLAGHHRR